MNDRRIGLGTRIRTENDTSATESGRQNLPNSRARAGGEGGGCIQRRRRRSAAAPQAASAKKERGRIPGRDSPPSLPPAPAATGAQDGSGCEDRNQHPAEPESRDKRRVFHAPVLLRQPRCHGPGRGGRPEALRPRLSPGVPFRDQDKYTAKVFTLQISAYSSSHTIQKLARSGQPDTEASSPLVLRPYPWAQRPRNNGSKAPASIHSQYELSGLRGCLRHAGPGVRRCRRT